MWKVEIYSGQVYNKAGTQSKIHFIIGVASAMKVMVETSAHHVHVSPADLETLFGTGATLTNKKDLSQPGQFACAEKVTVVGPKGEMKMSISGSVPQRNPGRNFADRRQKTGDCALSHS